MAQFVSRRDAVAGAAGGLLASLSGCLSGVSPVGDERETERRTYDVDAGTELRVRNRDGSITVEGSDGDAVELEVTRQGPTSDAVDAVSVTATESDGELRVETERADAEAAENVVVTLAIQCPPDVPVARLETTNGSIEATDVAGDPELESTNGRLTARRVDGTVSLTTSNAAITAREIGGLAGASTTNGAIDVDVPALDGDVAIETSSGAIDAALAPGLDVTLSATTSNGSVDVEGLDLSDATRSGSSVSGTLGDGTHALSLETERASITLRTLSA